jgi:hypothetical protein
MMQVQKESDLKLKCERVRNIEGAPVVKLLKVRIDTWSECAVARGATAAFDDEVMAGISVVGFDAEATVVETDALGTRALGGMWCNPEEKTCRCAAGDSSFEGGA